MRKKKISHEEFKKLAEYRILKVIERLNDKLPNAKKTGRGIWTTGSLDEGNSFELTYRKE